MMSGTEDFLYRLVISAPTFLLAIVLHEVAHGWVAYRLGDDTAKRAGRLTLSPIAHLDLVGSIVFVLSSLYGMGFGWAKPVPVMIERLRNPRRDEILVTLAGPVANLLQAVVWAVLLRLALRMTGGLGPALAVFCVLGLSINLLLLIFNLLPIPPLDGSHVALRLLGFDDPHLADRLAGLGFVVLFLFITMGPFHWLLGAVFVPLRQLFLPPGF